MDDAPDATGVYAPLAMQLRLRGVLTRQDGDALAVLDHAGEQVDTIVVEDRLDDADQPWLFDCEGIPIAQADDPIGAALAIVSTLTRSGIHA